MPGSDVIFDLLLGLLLLILAVAVVEVRRLYDSIILFIAFGLLLAVTWARLGAPDLALAEAAIGAGLTGVLLMAAYARSPDADAVEQRHTGWPAMIVVAMALFWLGTAVWPLATLQSELVPLAQQHLPDSGVAHPVTAVLLNFRAWDTLLELLVLLVALLGVHQLRLPRMVLAGPWPLSQSWSRLLAPLTVLIGGYLLWRGANAPGGAFQAGALLAAGLIILRLNQLVPELNWQRSWLRLSVLLGSALFLTVAAFSAGFGAGWLHYPQSHASMLIIGIETAATLSIAVTLAWLIIGDQESEQ